MSTKQEREKAEAVERLREILKPGDTVYTILRHVSRSGMTRIIDTHVIHDGEPRWIGLLTAQAVGLPFDRDRQGVKIGGCGMDIGFALVYDLAYTLWPNGAHNPHDSHAEHDGGYALRQRWM